MIGYLKTLSATLIVVGAMLGGTAREANAQVRRFPTMGMPMQQNSMMVMPQNLTAMQAANLATMNSMRPGFHHHHNWWMSPFNTSGMSTYNNRYTMGMLGGLYAMGYGGYGMGYGLGGYGMGYSGGYGGAYANPNGYSSRRYERDYPPATEEKPRTEVDPLDRVLNNASAADIASGRALNVILADLRKLASEEGPAGLPLFDVPLSENALRSINVTQGAGNLGILRSGADLTWPVALSGPEFQELRAQLTKLSQDAIRQARSAGRVDPQTTVKMNADLDELQKQIKPLALPFDQHVAAKTFLKNLEAAIVALQQPDIGLHFTGRYALTAETVPQLVKLMTDNGLQFAAAVPGDEAAYSALYQTLATFDRAARADRKNGS